MNILEKIQSNMDSFTPGERLVADYVIQCPIDAIRYSAEFLAERSRTSRSNVVRLCQKLGYSGFSEFKYEMNHYMNIPHISEEAPENSGGDLSENSGSAFGKYLTCFRQMEPLCSSPSLKESAGIISRSKKTLIFGIYHSYFTAQQLAFRLNRCGMDAQAVNDASIMDSYQDILSLDDTVVIISISGGKNFVELLKSYKKKGIKTILITMTGNSPSSRYVHTELLLPCITRQHRDAILDDAPVFYFFVELLMDEIFRQLSGRR